MMGFQVPCYKIEPVQLSWMIPTVYNVFPAALRRTHAWKVQNCKAWLYMTPTARGELEAKNG
jgi:hypothetical protein